MHFQVSYANAFNLDQSKILLSGNGLMFGYLYCIPTFYGMREMAASPDEYVAHFHILCTWIIIKSYLIRDKFHQLTAT